MRRAPSLKTLNNAFPSIPEENLIAIRDIIHGNKKPEEAVESTMSWAEQCYSWPKWPERAMHAIDVLLENYGVEVLEKPGELQARYLYSNSGDCYNPTLLYSYERGTIFLSYLATVAKYF